MSTLTIIEPPKQELKYYLFKQNNSGGIFFIDDRVTVNVFIQAVDAKAANRKAEDVGIYFDGCEDDRDCSCCGDRWYRVGDYDASAEPLIYGEPIEASSYGKRWTKEGDVYCRVYMADGVVKEYLK